MPIPKYTARPMPTANLSPSVIDWTSVIVHDQIGVHILHVGQEWFDWIIDYVVEGAFVAPAAIRVVMNAIGDHDGSLQVKATISHQMANHMLYGHITRLPFRHYCRQYAGGLRLWLILPQRMDCLSS